MDIDLINKYFLPIGILLTFLTTLLNLYFSRVNLKTSKYIDTITSERIKWLEKIRKEYSLLASKILYSIKIYKWQIENKESKTDSNKSINVYENYYDAQVSKAFKQRGDLWTNADFIERLILFKTRLNPKDDINIISEIDYFLKFYSETDYLDSKKISEAETKIKNLTTFIQVILKTEWEKCKYETKK